MAKRLGSIFENITQDTFITAGDLAKKVGLSERTIRSRIKEIDMILKKQGAEIVSRQNNGYQIRVYDETMYSLFLQRMKYNEVGFRPSNTKERVNLLVAYMIANRKKFTKIEEMIQFFYCSSNTISNDLKKAETIFSQYHIEIVRKPNYGLNIIGKEIDIRRLNAACLLQDNHFYFGNEKEKHDELWNISELLKNTLSQYKITANEIAFDYLVKSLYVQVKNILHGYHFKAEELIGINYTEEILVCADHLRNALAERFAIEMSDDEMEYIAFHIFANRSIEETRHNFIISDDILEDIQKMLNRVKASFSIDLTKDVEIQLSLAKHYVPFKIRLHYGLQLENPLLASIKERYAFAMEVSKEALLPIQLETRKVISEHEVSYFALIFEYALEKDEQTKQKKNILLVCSSGAGSTKLLLYKLHSEFKEYIHHITVKSIFTLEEDDFEQIDFIFSTVPINRIVPVPVVEINAFLGNQEFIQLRSVFEESEKLLLKDCFDEKLFFSSIQATNYEEVIRFLCNKIEEQYRVPSDFYESIIKREEMASTDFGNYIAVPHPYKMNGTQTIVAIAILEQPIMWHKQEVQVIFLISLNLKKEAAKIFYKALVEFANDEDTVRAFIKNRDLHYFFSTLIQEN